MLVMKVGILAAGAGSRLYSGGLHLPKPLLPIAGLPLIGYLLQALQQLDIDEIVCIINRRGGAVADYVRQHYPTLPLTFVQQDTASSFESFTVLCEHLGGSPSLVTTVDTVFDAALLPQFVAAARQHAGVDMMLSLTRFIDDEKPLYVSLDDQQRIVQLGAAAHDSGIVTSGLYYCAPSVSAACAALTSGSVVLRTATSVPLHGFERVDLAGLTRETYGCRPVLGALREFLAWLLEQGYWLQGYPGPKMIDVDRPQDIAVAETFVRELRSQQGGRR